MGDILACYAFNRNGKLLGASYGMIEMDDELRSDFSNMASRVWADLEKVTKIGGALDLVSITWQNFKVLGMPIRGSNSAIMVTIAVELDSQRIKDRVMEFVSYWMKVNHYLK